MRKDWIRSFGIGSNRPTEGYGRFEATHLTRKARIANGLTISSNDGGSSFPERIELGTSMQYSKPIPSPHTRS